MASGNSTASVRLPRVNRITTTINSLAAAVGLFCLVLTVGFAMERNPVALVWLVIPPVAVWLARRLPSSSSGDYAVLHADRMELLGSGRDVVWSEVVGIEWPKRCKDDDRRVIKIRMHGSEAEATNQIEVFLSAVGLEDKILLVRYIRQACGDCEQEHWAEFCHKYLVPNVERFCAPQASERDDRDPRDRPGVLQQLQTLLVTCYIVPLLLVTLVSRKVYLVTAVTLTISAFINIRLAWGAWLSPFTEIVLGFALACFVAALIPRRETGSKSRGDSVPVFVTLWYVSFAILLPFVANMVVQGHLVPPAWCWRVLKVMLQPLVMCSIYGPLFYLVWTHQRREKRLKPLLHADAERRWRAFVATGKVPPADTTLAAVR